MILPEYYEKAIHETVGDDFDVLVRPGYNAIHLSVTTAIAFSHLYGIDIHYCSTEIAYDHGDVACLLGNKIKDGDKVDILRGC